VSYSDASDMYGFFMTAMALLGVGALVALAFWMMGLKNIPALILIALGSAALVKFVVAPWLGGDL